MSKSKERVARAGDGKWMERIKEALGVRTQVELAARFGIRQSSISDARRRKSCPDSWLLELEMGYGFNPVWVLTGKGAKHLAPSTDRQTPDAPEPAHLLAARQTEDLITELAKRHPGHAVCIAPLPANMREGDLIGLHVVRADDLVKTSPAMALTAAGGV